MREVIPKQLWIGHALEARDIRLLCDERIEAVLDLAINEPPAQLTREMIYCRIPLVDGATNSVAPVEAAIVCLYSLLRQSFRTLVACSAGMSRSPAIAAAAIALVEGGTAKDCLLRIISGTPHDVSPSLWNTVEAVYERVSQRHRSR